MHACNSCMPTIRNIKAELFQIRNTFGSPLHRCDTVSVEPPHKQGAHVRLASLHKNLSNSSGEATLMCVPPLGEEPRCKGNAQLRLNCEARCVVDSRCHRLVQRSSENKTMRRRGTTNCLECVPVRHQHGTTLDRIQVNKLETLNFQLTRCCECNISNLGRWSLACRQFWWKKKTCIKRSNEKPRYELSDLKMYGQYNQAAKIFQFVWITQKYKLSMYELLRVYCNTTCDNSFFLVPSNPP